MRQTLLEAERIIGHYSNKIVYPQDSQPLCCCGEYPRYDILGKYVCEGCVSDYATETLPFEGCYCERCGEDLDGECIKIFDDYYHRECFDKMYGIE